MTIEKLALYGEMYPFLHEDQPYWWFDREHQTVIARDFLESEYGFDLQRQNIDEVVWSGFLPMFTVDIPALAMEYAKWYFEDRLWRELKALTGEDQWRSSAHCSTTPMCTRDGTGENTSAQFSCPKRRNGSGDTMCA